MTAKKPAKKAAKRSPAKRAQVLNVNHPGTRATISQEKYDLVSAAILAVVRKGGDGVPFRALIALVEGRLDTKERHAIGSVGWYVTTVKLDLEARKRIERVPGSNPQRLRRVR
jgi:hypothetical protein